MRNYLRLTVPQLRRWLSSQHQTAGSKQVSAPQHDAGSRYSPPPPPTLFRLDDVSAVPHERWWNITPSVQALFSRRLLDERGNPLQLLKQRILDHFAETHRQSQGFSRSPLFAVCDREPRLVSVHDNFDSLLVPEDHVSRSRSDTYYVNEHYCLRAHTSAHQCTLLRSGLDNFLVVGDVFRRDQIDRTHYPCFHQLEGVRTYSSEELFGSHQVEGSNTAGLFPAQSQQVERTPERQAELSADASRCLVIKLKAALEDLARALFGGAVETRWVDAYFPFTHPSFELEVNYQGDWMEVLGCGVMEQRLLAECGVGHRVGWAFGLGLERLAMVLYSIPDIRLFWSRDSGFLSQFANLRPEESFTYQPVSVHPQLFMDVSFWLPSSPSIQPPEADTMLEMKADVRDAIRSIGGDWVEQAQLIDDFWAAKRSRRSHCYRITYRSMERALTKDEVGQVHNKICQHLVERFGAEIR